MIFPWAPRGGCYRSPVWGTRNEAAVHTEWMRGFGWVVLLGMAVLTARPASAQRSGGIETQIFLPTPSAGTGFTVDRPELPRHLTFVAGLAVNGATGVFERDDDQSIVPYRVDAELLLALGLFEWIELGIAAPLVLASSTDDPFASTLSHSFAVRPGDLRLSAKVPIVRGDFAVSGRAVFTLPLGDGQKLLGQDYWSATPSVVAAYRSGPVAVGGELGWRFRQRSELGLYEQDDELQASLAVSVRVHRLVSLIGEAQIRAGLVGTVDADEVPVEVDGGARLHLGTGFSLDVGVGTGLTEGYGAPTVRGFAVLRYASEREGCPAGPEDFDGFEDGDFCADLDNDADGLLDADDECPNDAEDMDGFLDEDGCPDSDNDADGIMDDADRCPLESEDRDGFQDEDGCPEPDNDEDGILDGMDACRMEPEDHDDFEDDDGCPEPGPEAAVITVTDSRILISERIYFDFGSDTIRSVSLPLLDQVAEVIGALGASRHIRVEGYTDSEGNDEYNLDLSYRRARAVVEYLVQRGVARRRTDYVGYGEVQPVAPNDSPEGRALNRRVEFTIIEPTER